jgi:hypothetical protein
MFKLKMTDFIFSDKPTAQFLNPQRATVWRPISTGFSFYWIWFLIIYHLNMISN